ncbi:hypothetical protein [Saccharothrix xinjiangensis]|uniref:Uncharacterized protein n=1 Tax=Saccharothrix xinjiangensis TaxID=204798 RepID=A0ABV9YDK5_9PSEU
MERAHVDVVWREIAARKVAHERVEAQLVGRYRVFRSDVEMTSFVTPTGERADLYYRDGSETAVIEAKSLSTHGKVRESVACCAYRSADDLFETEEAPDERRRHMHPVWHGR